MLKKIISGGQTGADQGGLEAAVSAGIATGGWIPRGFLTEDGPCPDLKRFGLIETYDSGYVTRTLRNVRDSEGTLRVAADFTSQGEICTLRGIRRHGKPYMDISPSEDLHESATKTAQWIAAQGITILNVAGNRESVAPGIRDFTVRFLTEVLRCLQKMSHNGQECP